MGSANADGAAAKLSNIVKVAAVRRRNLIFIFGFFLSFPRAIIDHRGCFDVGSVVGEVCDLVREDPEVG